MLPIHLLAPPLIGAAIGYLTNTIAIRMLFRPLRPWRILGLRVPLTPGVIPSRRAQLADNIGTMVGSHLLTPADIQRAVEAPRFQAELQRLIDGWTAELLDRDLGPLPSLVPGRFQPAFSAGVKILRRRGIKLLQEYLCGPGFRAHLDELLAQGSAGLRERPWRSVFDAGTTEELLRFAEQAVHRFLAAERTEQWLAGELRRLCHTLRQDGRSLADILPGETQQAILEAIAAEVPTLLGHLGGLLADPAVRRRLAERLAEAAASFLDTLGPVAALLGGFLDRDTLAGQLERYLAEHSSEIAAWLDDPATSQRLAGLAQEKAASVLRQPVSRLLDRLGEERLAGLTSHLAGLAAGWLARPATARRIADLARQHLTGVAEEPIGRICATVFGNERLAAAQTWLAGEIQAAAGTSAFRRFLDRLAVSLVDRGILDRPIGRLRELLPRSVRQGISGWLQQRASALLVREVPRLVDGLDIKALIARKVNELDLLRLEDLLMGIMREQFKYINLFGGLLGFLIGLANLLLP